ncbi:hypothetical protein [Bacteroides timonensis]|uniref:hypothetical protein n=1 Tax=Bacteroides timonensis TaxID=1470345 RepID=UPI0004B2D6DC|nr:hypothetical protein [Bacteroides timonensis]
MKRFRFVLFYISLIVALFYFVIFGEIIFLHDEPYMILDSLYLFLIVMMGVNFIFIIFYDLGKEDKKEIRYVQFKSAFNSPDKSSQDTFLTKCRHIFLGNRKTLCQRLASLKEQNQALADKLEKRENCVREDAKRELKTLFRDRCNMNHLKLKVLVRIIQEADNHVRPLNLDDVTDLLRHNKISANEQYSYRAAFHKAFPGALARIEELCNLSRKEELYVMLVALEYSDLGIMGVLSMGSDSMEKLRCALCRKLQLSDSDTVLIDQHVRRVMLPDENQQET